VRTVPAKAALARAHEAAELARETHRARLRVEIGRLRALVAPLARIEASTRRIDPQSGAVLERLEMPAGIGVSGLESVGAKLFYCGGGSSGKVRAVRRLED
jgi:hypothetical protein